MNPICTSTKHIVAGVRYSFQQAPPAHTSPLEQQQQRKSAVMAGYAHPEHAQRQAAAIAAARAGACVHACLCVCVGGGGMPRAWFTLCAMFIA